ncbi:alpha/beta fold hydrolase (plasmid) [Azospirillum oryzae]|uniref:Proline iminopeptidase n=2 Tax=Azospirillum oryzae TaxID=286727 RepID=A0A6N1ADX0_9PROT|nr:alpha/beta fold hydrolase [Azospirillum oryzae]KAA0588236.1 alpha/beta hydrolase [Azospirillum oryzae]QKS49278.1 alpha/beta fold hydrolase [Azospirillum oryzae]
MNGGGRRLAIIGGLLVLCALAGGLLGLGIDRLTGPSTTPALAPAPAAAPSQIVAVEPLPAIPAPLPAPLPAAVPAAAPVQPALPALAEARCPDGPLPAGPAPRCRSFRVPSDWQRPDSLPVDLFVTILPALNGAPAADPVVLLSGGPGQGGSDDLRGTAAILAPMRAGRDVILVDQRGTGLSKPSLRCPGLDPLRYWFGGVTAEDATACLDPLRRSGYRLEDFDSGQSAADLPALRRALGVERWNVVATSYGGVLAQALLRIDGAAVRSLVLNSPATADATWLDLDRLTAIRQAHRRMVEDCAAQPDCARAFPRLGQAVERLAAALERRPLELRLRHPVTGRETDLRLDWPMLAGVLALRLGSGDGMVAVPALLDRLDRIVGDPAATGRVDDPAVLSLVMPPPIWTVLDSLAYGLNLTVGCRENRPHIDAGAARRAAADLRPFVMAEAVETDYDAACPALGLPPVDTSFYRPVAADVPALILTGAYDTFTAPARAEAMGRSLPRATLLSFRGLGHDVLGTSLCGRNAAARFVETLAVGDAGACVERLLPPTFATRP